MGNERESRSRVLKEYIAKGVRNGENNSGGKIAQEGKREDRGNLMNPGVVDIFTTEHKECRVRASKNQETRDKWFGYICLQWEKNKHVLDCCLKEQTTI